MTDQEGKRVRPLARLSVLANDTSLFHIKAAEEGRSHTIQLSGEQYDTGYRISGPHIGLRVHGVWTTSPLWHHPLSVESRRWFTVLSLEGMACYPPHVPHMSARVVGGDICQITPLAAPKLNHQQSRRCLQSWISHQALCPLTSLEP